MSWIAEWREGDQLKLEKFWNTDALFKWLQEYIGEHMRYPQSLTIYKADCVFDGSFKELKTESGESGEAS